MSDDHLVIRELQGIVQQVDLSKLESLVHGQRAPQLFKSLAREDGAHSPFLFNRGDVRTGNLSKRIFQEVYLGRDLFMDTYGEEPVFHDDEGYIGRERLIPTHAELSTLASSCILSIATGRPGVEAEYALDRFGIAQCFQTVVSEDDVVEAEKRMGASLRKPSPFSLRLCSERSGWSEEDRLYYVGDMPDDMVAARGAAAVPLGFVNRESDEGEDEREAHREILRQSGARAVFGSFQELIDHLFMQ
jgi:phosphoglycolate phosphatase-like HAD superfamily hydrolase